MTRNANTFLAVSWIFNFNFQSSSVVSKKSFLFRNPHANFLEDIGNPLQSEMAKVLYAEILCQLNHSMPNVGRM
jgi:hypothetical protein